MKTCLLRLVGVLLCLVVGTTAHAQATRTWVSGVGDDANPCSRTAPCKTFAGAISKTAANGEISVLDSGSFGAVTITKSITINGEGHLAGVLASLTSGIIVNAGANDVIVLRNLIINGAGNGTNGIRFLAGRHLHVENCHIINFTNRGIDMIHSGTTVAGSLVVENTTFTDIDSVAVRVDSSVGALAPSASLSGVRIDRAGIGFDVLKSAVGTIDGSTISHVTNQAIVAENTAVVNVADTVVTNSGTGVAAFSSGSTVRIANSRIFNNGTGVSIAAGATGDRFGNSQVFGNGVDVSGTLTFRASQ